jgi:DNA-binding NtrC family response regulator
VVEFLTKPCALGSLEAALDRARRKRGKTLPVPVGLGEPDEPQLHFSPEPRAARANGGMSLEELEQQHILAVLEKHAGNRATTAAELGISLRKLYYRLSQYQKQGLLQ